MAGLSVSFVCCLGFLFLSSSFLLSDDFGEKDIGEPQLDGTPPVGVRIYIDMDIPKSPPPLLGNV